MGQWDAGSIPSLAQWVKDPALPQLWLRSQLWLGFDPWPGNSICHGLVKNEKKKKKKKSQFTINLWIYFWIFNSISLIFMSVLHIVFITNKFALSLFFFWSLCLTAVPVAYGG